MEFSGEARVSVTNFTNLAVNMIGGCQPKDLGKNTVYTAISAFSNNFGTSPVKIKHFQLMEKNL